MKVFPRFSGAARHWSETPLAKIFDPLQEFIHNSASSGIVLMAATLLALILANCPLAATYEAVLHTYIGVSVGSFVLKYSLLHWINDGLMAIFFFLVGLEIKREILVGELANFRAALLPIAAAVGGVAVPALLYAAINLNGRGAAGWAIPMATDIAFALGILSLLGSRAPYGLKVFLTAVAIVDDLIAVLVIAFFYTSSINLASLSWGFGGLAFLMVANVLGIRTVLVYVTVGVGVWLAFLQSGVHATIAGVLVAWTVPARHRIDIASFTTQVRELLLRVEKSMGRPEGASENSVGASEKAAGTIREKAMVTDELQHYAIIQIEQACEDIQAPLQKMEHGLHFWVQFIIMPVFALANAGVAFSLESMKGEALAVPLGIGVGLILGKPIGLLGASWLAVRSGLSKLPEGTAWRDMIGVGFLAGIGFTMSLFVASLSFGESPLLGAAKTGILLASVTAGTIGFLLLRRRAPGQATE